MSAQLPLFPAEASTTGPVCLIHGTPMFRSAVSGYWVCARTEPDINAPDGVPYVHGKCWHAAKGATT